MNMHEQSKKTLPSVLDNYKYRIVSQHLFFFC